MADVIPEKYLDLFQKKAFAHLATINADGTPQVTPVWVDYDGNAHTGQFSARPPKRQEHGAQPRSGAVDSGPG